MKYIIALLLLLYSVTLSAQNFKYAFVTDTHVGSETGEEDLRRTVKDINEQADIDFILITGDITEMGTKLEIQLAKSILESLRKPWYVIPGNHDTGWSESGGVDFIKEFGYDKFTFDHAGYRFVACASGPYVRMSDGHIPRDATIWLDSVLNHTSADMPIVFINHYPLDNSLDNWYEATDRLKKQNIQYAICGHGHSNTAYDFEGIAGTMGRSNLRAKDSLGGYNIVEMGKDSVFFCVKKPGETIEEAWRKISLKKFDATEQTFERPSYSVNASYPKIKQSWTYHAKANVTSTPAVNGQWVIFGNSLGEVEALSLKDGQKKWGFQTRGAIYSSPAIAKNIAVLGSGDGYVYAFKVKSGELLWKFKTDAAVLGSAVIQDNNVFIGGSDGNYYSLQLKTGRLNWIYRGIAGAIVGKPLLYEGKIIFGSWGRSLYALNQATGTLIWKWDNGHPNRMFSPAMCTPVAAHQTIFIAAPDRVLTAIDANSGQTLWRNKEATVRESIGISAKRNLIYGKTMNDEIVAYETARTDPGISWRLNMKYGYEHAPSMLVEKDGLVFFGTRNGVVYTFDPVKKEKVWAHKIDNSMVNTVNIINKKTLLVATMDGKVVLLKQID